MNNHRYSKIAICLIVCLVSCLIGGDVFGQIVVTNPPGRTAVAWDASPDTNVVGYRVYWSGIGSRHYTNFVEITGRSVTYATITPLVRGVKYYFAATSVAQVGTERLESQFSNEVTDTPVLPPTAPTLRLSISPLGKTINGTGGIPRGNYEIQRTSSLTNWSTLRVIEADDDGEIAYSDSEPPMDLAFYRVKQQ